MEKKRDCEKLHFSRLESRSSFSNIWDNKTSILLSKEENQTRSSLFYQYTPIVMDKSGFPMILLPKK
jgi:hypothetical protein